MNSNIKFSLAMTGCIYVLVFSSCRDQNPEQMSFKLLKPDRTGIHFSNDLEETHQMNNISYPDFFSGGGVSVGDIDNDGLPDIFFVGNQKPSRLYKNLGDFRFKDITQSAGLANLGRGWFTGTCMVDVNGDGWLDIQISKSGMDAPDDRANLLFINNGDGTFAEKSKELGLQNQGFSVNTTFFDYDRDGDLDAYVANQVSSRFTSNDAERIRRRSHPYAGDKLYENVHGKFIDVTEQAGLYSSEVGFAHGITVGDFNDDGWDDIYVSNDFFEYDYLYLNNGDKTFREVLKQSMKHVPHFSMGNDAADINNDGLLDIVVLDMVAEDNRRLYMNTGGPKQKNYERIVFFELHHQYMFNILQLNNGNGTFSEIGTLSGMARTDWSWAPLLADFNNDGCKDLYVTNGLRKDVRNIDWGQNYNNLTRFASDYSKFEPSQWDMLLNSMPSEQIVNYMFRNNGDLTFSKVMDDWGMNHPSWSNGAAWADLDNDGDLDLVVNNVDAPAFIYENRCRGNHYLRFKIEGPEGNKMGLGTKVRIYHGNNFQYQQHFNTRGYRSSVEPVLHFGLGQDTLVHRVEITWPDGKTTLLQNLKSNSVIVLNYNESSSDVIIPARKPKPLFEDVTEMIGSEWKHRENEMSDFVTEPTLPYKLSSLGPALAVADVDGDGYDDFFIGGSYTVPAQLLLQQEGGGFRNSQTDFWKSQSIYEDTGAAFFDFDGDGDPDLYVASGGNENRTDKKRMQHRLYINDGKGVFSLTEHVLPEIYVSGKVVKPFDYDDDGDLDLFIGGRFIIGQYGQPPDSYLLINESGIFEDATDRLAPEFRKLGMVTDAVWSDYNNEGKADLIVVGEWMPVTVFTNQNERLLKEHETKGLENTNGWWQSIAAADLDLDGDDDYVLGNMGYSYKFRAPLELYSGHLDESGKIIMVMGYYEDGKIYPASDRYKLIGQSNWIERSIPSDNQFALMTVEEIYGKEKIANALNLKIQTLASGYLENQGKGIFQFKPFENLAQASVTNSIIIRDFNKDGRPDIITAGNFYDMEAETIRLDAGIGCYLEGDGTGDFRLLPTTESGLFVDGDIRNVAEIQVQGRTVWLFVRNQDTIKAIGLTE